MSVSLVARRPAVRGAKGVALVVVLAFVVLLTGLMVALFSRAVTSRQLSNSSNGQTRAAILAKSAADTVVGGFKSEIVAGSLPTPNPAPSYRLYIPATAANAVPMRCPTPAPSPNPELIPNLVRESKSGDTSNGTLPSPAVPSYASAVNSFTDSAIGGRNVTLARWNSHYLIPCFDAVAAAAASGSTATSSTPDTSVNFTAPDWVMVTRNGPAVVANNAGSFSGTSAVSNPAVSNTNFVVGRYAYAVYDEGGLLDMNVAGYPSVSPTPSPASSGFTAAQIGRKGSLALADLTQLPIVKTPGSQDPAANASDYLAPSVVNSIVAWRNYASANLGGAPFANASFVFSPSQTASWFTNFVGSNTKGFLNVYGGATGNTGATDQALASRQALLRLRTSLNFSPNALQYMGTFSRSLDQPAYIPAHLRYPKGGSVQEAPNINAVSTATPPVATAADTYTGVNDAAGFDADGSISQDKINPSLLTVRVAAPFTRNDGSTSVVGEPLVKKRFSLQRLAWVTYKGPSANNMADVNVRASITGMGGNPDDPTDPIYKLVAQGNTTNIANYFGLNWSNGVWTYNHGVNKVMRLSEVAAANRDPDFAELLKAAINAGSLAKGAPNLNYYSGPVLNYQYTLDTTLDYNVLQIMANLIDQFDADSYPTVIQIQVSVGVYRTMRGVEDLPYFYRYHPFSVVKTPPSPMLMKGANGNVSFTVVSTPTPSPSPSPQPIPTTVTPVNCVTDSSTTISNPGEVELLFAPDVWNPHDPNAVNGTTGSRPTQFRLSVQTTDPVNAASASPNSAAYWKTGVRAHAGNDYYGNLPAATSVRTTGYQLNDTSSAFTFSDDNGKLFREPTLLWRTDAPANANITPEAGSLAGPYTDANTGVAYVGTFVGRANLMYSAYVDPTKFLGSPRDPNDKYVFQAEGDLEALQVSIPASSPYRQFLYRLQYKDPTTNLWVIYDEKWPDLHGLSSPQSIVNPADFPNNLWQNPYLSNQLRDCATGYDPRVARFGIGTANDLNADNTLPLLEASAASAGSGSSSGNAAAGASKFTVMNSLRPSTGRGNQTRYSGPCQTSDPGNMLAMRWYSGKGWNAAGSYSSPYDVSTTPDFYSGLLGQNIFTMTLPARNNSTITQIYYEDADGVARRAMGAYADTSLTLTPTTGQTIGLPESTASNYPTGNAPGVGTAISQSQSRPLILNRPFRTVAEMSYASRGGIWKQLDFFTPESGDVGLLDFFCVNDPPADAVVAGKVNLNTHQAPVLKAILAGAYRDEVNNFPAANYSGSAVPPAYRFGGLSPAEAANAASKVINFTKDTSHAWHGPLTNVSELVGRFVPSSAGASGQSDTFTYTATSNTGVPNPNPTYSFAGLVAGLDQNIYTNSNDQYHSTAKIQRMREAAIRPLADVGQTRVWNLFIDVVAQVGRYPSNATSLSQFSIEGEKRFWVHVAIDRATGEVIDRQTEEVTE